MPVMDGFTAYRKLRERSETFPVILSSGFNEADIAQQIQDDERVSFLQKPYASDLLKKQIAALIG